MAGKKFKCGGCGAVSESDDINNTTIINCCFNRSLRRKYVPIERTISTDKKWYRCPICGGNVRRKGWTDNE